jgi:hypothetical protein
LKLSIFCFLSYIKLINNDIFEINFEYFLIIIFDKFKSIPFENATFNALKFYNLLFLGGLDKIIFCNIINKN